MVIRAWRVLRSTSCSSRACCSTCASRWISSRSSRRANAELQALREQYWREVREGGADVGGKVFVDKHPLHSLKLPLIARLFPNAKILFAIRDPRDVVLSGYRRRFAMNPAMFQLLTPRNGRGLLRCHDAHRRDGPTVARPCVARGALRDPRAGARTAAAWHLRLPGPGVGRRIWVILPRVPRRASALRPAPPSWRAVWTASGIGHWRNYRCGSGAYPADAGTLGASASATAPEPISAAAHVVGMLGLRNQEERAERGAPDGNRLAHPEVHIAIRAFPRLSIVQDDVSRAQLIAGQLGNARLNGLEGSRSFVRSSPAARWITQNSRAARWVSVRCAQWPRPSPGRRPVPQEQNSLRAAPRRMVRAPVRVQRAVPRSLHRHFAPEVLPRARPVRRSKRAAQRRAPRQRSAPVQ